MKKNAIFVQFLGNMTLFGANSDIQALSGYDVIKLCHFNTWYARQSSNYVICLTALLTYFNLAQQRYVRHASRKLITHVIM